MIASDGFAALDTPFVTVDLEAVERNIDAMQRYCDEHDIDLRAHIKTHKLPEIADMQLAAGAAGLCCQKLGEAEMLLDHGCRADLLITFPLVGARKAARFAELAARGTVAVGADSETVARELSAALAARGTAAGFLVDCDTGYGRTGVQTPAEAARLAELVDALPGLSFRGLMTHPTRAESGPWLRAAGDLIAERGLAVECVSGGGTPDALRTHELGVITELRVGNYVYGDRWTAAAGWMPLEDCALRIRSTVVSTPTSSRAVLDAGSKTLGSDRGPAPDADTYGRIVEYPEAVIRELSEEHGHVDVSACERAPALGEMVTVIPNHACTTVNLHDEVALHGGGRDVRIARVAGRGLVR
jgi:D-serine deaminase-like pyridoxal phosphate-dependent protein